MTTPSISGSSLGAPAWVRDRLAARTVRAYGRGWSGGNNDASLLRWLFRRGWRMRKPCWPGWCQHWTTWLGSAGSTSQRSPDSTQPRRSLRRSKRSPGISRPPKRCDRKCRSTTDSHEGERTNPRCLFPAELYARATCVPGTFDLTPHPKPKSHAGAGSDDCHREAGDCIDSRRDDYAHNQQQCGEVEENELR